MAKLTLSFKGHLISIHHLGEAPTRIGRDADCEIVIDSLAVAPHHATISVHPDGYSITIIDDEHPVLLNNEKIEEAPLHHGDLIQIGKHTLHYAEAAQEVAVMPAAPKPPDAVRSPQAAIAYVQIQSGPDIGRVLALRRESTRLTRVGANEVVIARRGEGYVVNCDDPAREMGINGRPVPSGTAVPLPEAALIEIGDLRCRFFHGNA